MKKKTTTPAFGTSLKRFVTTGINPSLDPAKAKASSQLGPGSYNPREIKCKVPEQRIEPWTRKLMLENFSKYRGYKAGDLLRRQKELERFGGPGLYTVPNKVYERQSKLAIDNLGLGRANRFKEPKMVTPGPGSHDVKKIKTPTTTVQTFEWDGCADRFKDTEPRYKLPPNNYAPKDTKSIDALLERRVSHLRNIYDCFTGPRDETTIKNHFAKPHFQKPDRYCDYPSCFDDLLKRPQGKMSKTERFPRKPCLRILLASLSKCYRDPLDPGPAAYDLTKYSSIRSEKVKHSHDILFYPPYVAFNSSDWGDRTKTVWKTQPAPGRYYYKNRYLPTVGSNAPAKGHWVFKSKVAKQGFKLPEEYTYIIQPKAM